MNEAMLWQVAPCALFLLVGIWIGWEHGRIRAKRYDADIEIMRLGYERQLRLVLGMHGIPAPGSCPPPQEPGKNA